MESKLLALILEFENDNWVRIHPQGSPEPSGNQFRFADFCNWLEDRATPTTKGDK